MKHTQNAGPLRSSYVPARRIRRKGERVPKVMAKEGARRKVAADVRGLESIQLSSCQTPDERSKFCT